VLVVEMPVHQYRHQPLDQVLHKHQLMLLLTVQWPAPKWVLTWAPKWLQPMILRLTQKLNHPQVLAWAEHVDNENI
jgi:hypothetical protein